MRNGHGDGHRPHDHSPGLRSNPADHSPGLGSPVVIAAEERDVILLLVYRLFDLYRV